MKLEKEEIELIIVALKCVAMISLENGQIEQLNEFRKLREKLENDD